MTDLISYVPSLPKAGETIHGTKFSVGFGGKGANQAVMAAKLGASTAMVGKLGSDTFGDNYMENLRNVGVDVTHVGQVEGPSGVATITVDDKAENCIVIVAGANSSLCEEDIHNAKGLLTSCKVAVFQMEIPLETNLAALNLIKKYNSSALTIYNAAPATDCLSADLYPLVDIFCVNESEAEKLLGLESVSSVAEATAAASALVKLGCKMGMITLGSNGVVFVGQDGVSTHVPCPKVKAVDTTGAGDAFIGSLACLLADEKLGSVDFSRKVEVACGVASESVTKHGTQTSYPSSYKL